ncbi:MAG: type II 3-dehydroquinate dehydratase [Gammaproteobacteria bacterium]|nr:type II 3-dehydroquinate dehydratase [Gammaproteobacteria bacterium]
MAHILLLNGPNLNLLGAREPDVYGSDSLDNIEMRLQEQAGELGHSIVAYQSNSESDLVDRIQQAAIANMDFAICNLGAFTHTSVAIRDALLGTSLPFIEVHISNVYAREEFRHHSYISDIAVGCIVGLGTFGYDLALAAIDQHLNAGK